ncbi:MAG: hemerythrin domain-containing protein [Methanobacteriaceae archaeon]|nr:hemerythrin domain-containing protein [Methanobacteriaceae archaeon]
MAGNLYEMLNEDHTKVKDLLENTIEEESVKEFPQIKNELEVHMEGEKEYFYPDLKKDDSVTIIEGYHKHSLAKKVIKDIEDEMNETDEWIARVKVLQDLIEHHIKEEKEEDKIFKLAKKNLNKIKEYEIYTQFEDLKKKNDLM